MTDAHSLLMARTAWAFSVLSSEVARGRSLGYLPGELVAHQGDPAAARRLITEQLGEHPITQQLVRADCTDAEQDALWLLACGESEPAIARLIEGLHGGSDIAADEECAITAAHLERAARVEYEAMGKLVA